MTLMAGKCRSMRLLAMGTFSSLQLTERLSSTLALCHLLCHQPPRLYRLQLLLLFRPQQPFLQLLYPLLGQHRLLAKLPVATARRARQVRGSASPLSAVLRGVAVKRIDATVANDAQQVNNKELRDILRDAAVVVKHAGSTRNTVTKSDVLYALSRNGRKFYG